jgi:GT2 family glycosyltransferase
MAPPAVTVIAVNFNGRDLIGPLGRSLSALTYPNLELVLVDNGSSDDSVAQARRSCPALRVMELGRNLGFARANNLAIRASRSPYVCLVNSDVVVEPGFLTALVEAAEADANVAACAAKLRLDPQREVLNGVGGAMNRIGWSWDRGMYEVDRGQYDRSEEVLFASAGACLYRRAAFLEAGGFDEAFFMYHEDVDLSWRLWLLGGRSVTVPAAIAYHRFGASSRKSGDLRERLGERHNIRALLKNYEAARTAVNLGRLLSLRRSAALWWRLLQGLGWNLARGADTWRQRRSIQDRRSATDRDLDRLILDSDGLAAIVPSYRIARPEDFREQAPPPVIAVGRGEGDALGYGWHPLERCATGLLRWSSFEAQLFLGSLPGARAVALELAAPPAGLHLALELMEGGKSLGAQEIHPGAEVAAEFQLPPACDRILDLRLRISPTWSPHELFGNRDFRRLGIGLRSARLRA